MRQGTYAVGGEACASACKHVVCVRMSVQVCVLSCIKGDLAVAQTILLVPTTVAHVADVLAGLVVVARAIVAEGLVARAVASLSCY